MATTPADHDHRQAALRAAPHAGVILDSCRELHDLPSSTLYHYLHADRTLKDPARRRLGTRADRVLTNGRCEFDTCPANSTDDGAGEGVCDPGHVYDNSQPGLYGKPWFYPRTCTGRTAVLCGAAADTSTRARRARSSSRAGDPPAYIFRVTNRSMASIYVLVLGEGEGAGPSLFASAANVPASIGVPDRWKGSQLIDKDGERVAGAPFVDRPASARDSAC